MDYNFVGIDLGSKTSIVAHLRGQTNNIILNQIGGRETPVCISYSDQQRLFGEQAVVSTRSRPLATILTPQRFLTDDPKQLQIEAQYTLARFDKDHFHVQGANFDLDVTPQEVLTGYLNYLHSLTRDIPQTSPTFYSVSVPNHLGYKARKQLYKCVSAIVPNPPSLVSQKMAVGLDYLINTSKQKQTVLFVDFGHCKLSAYALKFTDSSIVEIIEGSYSNLGVRCLDVELIKYFESLIKFKLNDKSRLKLRDIAARSRMILSANSELTIQQDFGDNDFQCKLNREQFQKICETPFGYVRNFLELTKKNILQRGIKIDRIEVFGGGSRIPHFQQILSSIFKLPARKAINNEAISRGCALYAHHREKISKLGKIQLKELMKVKIKLFINHYQKQAVGRDIDPRRAQNLQTHLLYDIGAYNDDKKLSIQPRKDHSIEIWFVTEENQPMVEYYNIFYDQIDKEIININFDITMSQGYPKIRSISGQMKNPGLTKPVPFCYDSKQQIDALRAKELEIRAVDLRIIAIQEKRNKIQSEIFRVKDRYPEAEKYYETMRTMNIYELDQAIKHLTEIQ